MSGVTRRGLLAGAGLAGVGVALPATATGAPASAGLAPVSSSYDTLVLSHQPQHYFQRLDVDAGQWIDVVRARHATFPDGYGSDVLANGELVPHFDGHGQYAEAGDSSYFGPAGAASQWTVECWFRPDTLQFPNDQADIYVHWMGKGDGSGAAGRHEWTARMYNQVTPGVTPPRPNWVSGYVFSAPGGIGCGQAYTGGLDARTWHHYVFVVDHLDRRVALWFDGTQAHGWVSMDAYDITVTNGTAPLRIGTRDFASFFQGAVGKLAFYTRQLSPERIAEHYAAGPFGPSC